VGGDQHPHVAHEADEQAARRHRAGAERGAAIDLQPRKSPDERVYDAMCQIMVQIRLMREAALDGGSFPRPGIISGLRYALSEIPEHVLTPMEQEAAAND
jgi:hypothetical protein